MKPLAHRDAVLLQNVGEQLVLYDQKRRRLHVLSRSAALVWQHCDGQRDVAQLVEIVGRELGAPASDELILLALEQLDEAALLTARHDATPPNPVTRREMMSRALGGLAAGILMPVVTSCGSIVDSTLGATASTDIGALDITTTTTSPQPGTTTTSTSPQPGTTTTTTSPQPGTTTTTTSPLPGTTTTTTSPQPGTTTTTTSPQPGTTTTTTSPQPGTTTTTTSPQPGTTTTTTTAAPTTPLPKKVQMCHKGKAITVDQRAVPAHLANGDTLGPCP